MYVLVLDIYEERKINQLHSYTIYMSFRKDYKLKDYKSIL